MPITWSKSTETYNNADNSFHPIVMFGNSEVGDWGYCTVDNVFVQMPDFAFGKFMPYDLKQYGVTADANYADIGGIDIITNTGELQIAMRAPGSTVIISPAFYQEQSLSALPNGGMRVVSYDTVPLVNGCFEASVTIKNYPNVGVPVVGSPSAVGYNLKLKKWGR